MRAFEVLKDVFVSSGPPMILLKGAKIKLCYAKGHPVLGSIFEDCETHETINQNSWQKYFKL
ncbi:MAG: hypothetical protein WC325_11635 [Candidatus Bathyarchaeia archaeon]|jgi:hypothetical protein